MIDEKELAAARRADLDRRVAEVTKTEAETFPRLSTLEWTLAWVACAGIPLLVWRWFA